MSSFLNGFNNTASPFVKKAVLGFMRGSGAAAGVGVKDLLLGATSKARSVAAAGQGAESLAAATKGLSGAEQALKKSKRSIDLSSIGRKDAIKEIDKQTGGVFKFIPGTAERQYRLKNVEKVKLFNKDLAEQRGKLPGLERTVGSKKDAIKNIPGSKEWKVDQDLIKGQEWMARGAVGATGLGGYALAQTALQNRKGGRRGNVIVT